MDLIVKNLDWKWNLNSHELFAVVTMADGQTIGVRLPVSTLAARLESELGAVDIVLPATVSGPETVAGFGRMLKKAKKALKKAGKSVKKTLKKFKKGVVDTVVHGAKQLARSKALGGVLGAAAVAFPAVGGPALAAWTTANRVVAYADKAERAGKRLAKGIGQAHDLTHVRNAKQLGRNLSTLARSATPAARMLIAATKSRAA